MRAAAASDRIAVNPLEAARAAVVAVVRVASLSPFYEGLHRIRVDKSELVRTHDAARPLEAVNLTLQTARIHVLHRQHFHAGSLIRPRRVQWKPLVHAAHHLSRCHRRAVAPLGDDAGRQGGLDLDRRRRLLRKGLRNSQRHGWTGAEG